MGTDVKSGENRLASYIGISGPDTPKYLHANNFLAEFFQDDVQSREMQYTCDMFYKKKILLCEEDNDQKKKQLEESFDYFFRKFSGEDLIPFNDKRHYYFPLRPQMLRSSSTNLRHLLYCMIPGIEKEETYHEIQDLLYEYLYSGADGVSYLMGVICEDRNFDQQSWKRATKRNYESDMLKAANFKKVCVNFKEDLMNLLTHDFFRRMDFYKRYDYLATLLNCYVIQFIINKKAVSSNRGYVLCQGSSHLARCGAYHRACVQNYSEIRFVFQTELKQFYIECLKEEQAEDKDFVVEESEGKIYVTGKNESKEFIQFVRQVFHSNIKDKMALSLYPAVRRVFALDEKKKFSAEEFAMCYMDVSSARKGSALVKISSALNTCGKDIAFVFPKTHSRHKYFALSPSLLDFFVRLYLAKQESTYAYLDNFLNFLQDWYGICIQKNARMDRMLKSLHIKVPFQEFRLNEQALIDNLDEINCLIRLSDSGYVITLPEEKGEFALL